ncbi:MAG TPA: hypothetical protein VFA85_03785 [Terriglobales bacterium]|nr:hypothetical protein [Terriglobales bacterium]
MKLLATLLIVLTAMAFADTGSEYQKGTLTKQNSVDPMYELVGTKDHVWVRPCGEFQNGQAIEFRVAGDKAYIRRQNGKDYKCTISMTSVPNDANSPKYHTGTILGYSIRRDPNAYGTGTSSSIWIREAKVYDLKASDFIYKIDYCGSFQAGQFSPGQVLEFRVNENEGRLYVRHDGNKEYSCQLEGKRLPDTAADSQNSTGSSASFSVNAKPAANTEN